MLAVGSDPDRRERDAVDQHLAACRLEQPKHDLHEGRFASTGGAHDGDELARFDDKIEVLEDERLGFGIPEPQVPKLYPAFDRPSVRKQTVMAGFERIEGNVAQALQMQVEDSELDCLLDQKHGLFSKILLVAHKGEDHSDRERVVECETRGQINGHNIFQTEYRVIHGLECDDRSSQPNIRVHDIGISVQPLPLPLVLPIEQLQALDRPHRFDEGRILLGLFLRLFLGFGVVAV
jgi:hypothetical protein